MINPAHNLSLGALAVLSFSLLGCADKEPPKSSPSQRAPVVGDSDDGLSGSIVVDDEIAELCALPTSHFAFDRATISAASSSGLDELVTCLSSGGARGRALSLVGHADPRGERQYNFALGQRRAGSVEAYLSEHGIAGSRMTTSSRGELDATGVDAAGWAADRTVEILLEDE